MGREDGVGGHVLRKEDDRFLRGRGSYVSDMVLPGQSEVAFLRSPVAHGYLRSIRKPAGSDGTIFTYEDLTGLNSIVSECAVPGFKMSELPPLARGKVRFVGEALAMTVAPTRAAAEDLAEQVEIDIDELPAIVDARASRATPAVRVHEDWDDNLFVTLNYENGFEAQARGAKVVVKRTVSLARQTMSPLEGKAVVAYWDDRADQLIVYTSTQVPHMIRIGLAEALGLDEGRLRVVSPDVGGGFGYKCVLQPEELCVAWLALTYRRPFRYIEDRREHLVVGAVARQHHYELTAYADETGRLLALDAEIMVDGGAYSSWPFTAGLEPGQAVGNLPGPYDFRGYRCKSMCAATNKPGFLPYRGVARTGVCLALELMIDAIAREVGREPWEVRHDNLVAQAQMPYDNVARKHYDSGDYQKCLRMARDKIDLDTWRARQRRGEPDGRRIGIGFASFCEQTAHGASVLASWGLPVIPGYDEASVRITPDGGAEVRVGVHSHGQGMETTLAQVANEILGIGLDKIRVIHGDTGATPFSTGTYASRSIVMAGGAVINACRLLVPRVEAIGAHLMQCATATVRYEDGRIVGPQSSTTLKEVAYAWHRRPDRLPPDCDLGGLEATVSYKPKVDTGVFSYASHAAVVAVDLELGHIEILDYVIAEDCGTMVNPMVVEGQTLGGVAQGIGTALYEESPYDENGQPLASTLADYLLPGAGEVPSVRIEHLQTPSPYSEFGIKGVGEGGAIAPPAVLFNAVNDALHDLGVEMSETPLTPHRLLAALERARSRTARTEPA
ncbi:xanthine dehydrogenase family protein molybdopterin-binding subunit [Enterovirga sp.]|uniref:xanthine dehydrogenase family protein molybdopterin-binding subunit n=1 Tax=Enterovirga sp. TaxID=2026350 RepID=UPI0026218ACC|nr:xanthine dehydrogenase family protein molybdopterin-binding subunit [Enterovirga sp.]MDB5590544.1 carbon monoxide dehydrogenase [Enterovirga sp.]